MEKIDQNMNLTCRVSRRQRRINKKRQFYKKVRRFIIISILVCIMLVTTGIGLIRLGICPQLQKFLVTSAMTTMSHKYIANIVASDSKIKSILEDNRVVEDYEKFDQSNIVKGSNSKDGDTVEIKDISRNGYKGYMLIVNNPKKVFLGTSHNLGSYGDKISQIVKDYNALAGVNAGGFSDENGCGKGGTPTGIIIENGEIKYIDKNIKKFNIIGFNNKDILVVGQYTLNEVKKLDLRDAVDFRPFLIVNGKPTKMYGDGGWGIAPRTAIGQRSDGTVLLVVIDGRQLHSAGATMKELQNIMIENQAVNAANLDGGSSSVMYFEGKIINKPSSVHGDRYLPSVFLIDSEVLIEGNVINNLNN